MDQLGSQDSDRSMAVVRAGDRNQSDFQRGAAQSYERQSSNWKKQGISVV